MVPMPVHSTRVTESFRFKNSAQQWIGAVYGYAHPTPNDYILAKDI